MKILAGFGRFAAPIVIALGLSAGAAQADFTVALKEVKDLKAVLATVESVDQVRARARIGGTLAGLAVDEGSEVTAGARIARVVDEKLALQIKALDARLRSVSTRRDLAAAELKRGAELKRRGNISQARLDQLQAEEGSLAAEMAALQAERAVLVRQLEEGDVLAPAAGRVLRVAVTDGSVVMAGEVVAEIATARYVLRIQVPERHARFMQAGDPVLVGGRGQSGGERAQGTVRQVYPRIDRGRVVADVTVDGLGDFFVGERVRVWVEVDDRQAFVVPEAYLDWRFGLSYVKLKSGARVVVQTGRPVDGGIEVLSGLADGDVLVMP